MHLLYRGLSLNSLTLSLTRIFQINSMALDTVNRYRMKKIRRISLSYMQIELLLILFLLIQFLKENNRHSKKDFSTILNKDQIELVEFAQLDNRQIILQTINTDNSAKYLVLIALRIKSRAQRINMSKNEPLVVFKNSQGRINFITNKMITTYLQSLASRVYNIMHEKILAL